MPPPPASYPYRAIYRKRKVLLKVVTLQFLERGKTASALQGKGDVGPEFITRSFRGLWSVRRGGGV